MRIRKRFIPPQSFPSDLRLSPSATAPPLSDPPSHKILGNSNRNTRWGWPHPQICNNDEKMEEFGDDETRREEERRTGGSNDVRKITISYEQESTNITIMQPSSSSADHQVGRFEGENYKLVVPLKKRKGSFDRNPTESSKMKSKSSKKWVELRINEVDKKIGQDCNNDSNGGGAKKSKIMEGSRCSRVNGRGWRCCQPTLVGYALCEHHLGKGRLRSMGSGCCREVGGGHQQLMMISTMKRRKKARSISSLLSQV